MDEDATQKDNKKKHEKRAKEKLEASLKTTIQEKTSLVKSFIQESFFAKHESEDSTKTVWESLNDKWRVRLSNMFGDLFDGLKQLREREQEIAPKDVQVGDLGEARMRDVFENARAQQGFQERYSRAESNDERGKVFNEWRQWQINALHASNTGTPPPPPPPPSPTAQGTNGTPPPPPPHVANGGVDGGGGNSNEGGTNKGIPQAPPPETKEQEKARLEEERKSREERNRNTRALMYFSRQILKNTPGGDAISNLVSGIGTGAQYGPWGAIAGGAFAVFNEAVKAWQQSLDAFKEASIAIAKDNQTMYDVYKTGRYSGLTKDEKTIIIRAGREAGLDDVRSTKVLAQFNDMKTTPSKMNQFYSNLGVAGVRVEKDLIRTFANAGQTLTSLNEQLNSKKISTQEFMIKKEGIKNVLGGEDALYTAEMLYKHTQEAKESAKKYGGSAREHLVKKTKQYLESEEAQVEQKKVENEAELMLDKARRANNARAKIGPTTLQFYNVKELPTTLAWGLGVGGSFSELTDGLPQRMGVATKELKKLYAKYGKDYELTTKDYEKLGKYLNPQKVYKQITARGVKLTPLNLETVNTIFKQINHRQMEANEYLEFALTAGANHAFSLEEQAFAFGKGKAQGKIIPYGDNTKEIRAILGNVKRVLTYGTPYLRMDNPILGNLRGVWTYLKGFSFTEEAQATVDAVNKAQESYEAYQEHKDDIPNESKTTIENTNTNSTTNAPISMNNVFNTNIKVDGTNASAQEIADRCTDEMGQTLASLMGKYVNSHAY